MLFQNKFFNLKIFKKPDETTSVGHIGPRGSGAWPVLQASSQITEALLDLSFPKCS